MVYNHSYRVRAPFDIVYKFHQRTSSMAAITPPPLRVKVNRAPTELTDGDQMAFALMFGPIPINWVAGFESVSSSGFTDRQIKGPFRKWVHQHKFIAIGDELTEVRDSVEVEVKRHLIWGPFGFLMWAGMPLLFAYRGWKTRRLLEHRA